MVAIKGTFGVGSRVKIPMKVQWNNGELLRVEYSTGQIKSMREDNCNILLDGETEERSVHFQWIEEVEK